MRNHLVTHLNLRLTLLLSLGLLFLAGCTLSLIDTSGLVPPTPTLPFPLPPITTPQPNAEVTFDVSLPAPLLPGESL